MPTEPRQGESAYRTLDDAVRDGWSVLIHPGPPWWDPTKKLRYAVTAKKHDYHVEMGGNSLVELRREVRRMVGPGPWPGGRFGRAWWAERMRGGDDAR